ncbi:MAG: hypothetical protein HUU21_23030 [Polyangiaceae bacterium]|nr:hypothetical protein [Polyangiaceae bacterium]NUQ76423.1 hypothetical protein [Polyangiaceae bacterium]
MQHMIAQLISAIYLSLSSAAISPVNAIMTEDICGKGQITAGSECSLLSGDACTAACDATDWPAYCNTQCCEEGADYGVYGQCDPKCMSACEYNSWGDCTFNWCGAGSSALFCDGAPKATNGELDACLDYLCYEEYDVDGLVCGSSAEPSQRNAPPKR